jgi:hypothetical protein
MGRVRSNRSDRGPRPPRGRAPAAWGWAGLLAGLLAVPLGVTPLRAGPTGPPGHGPRAGAEAVLVTKQGDAYCFARPLVVGDLRIAGGRCYTFYLLRTARGAFVALGPAGPPLVPPGQIVRLTTPAGAKVKGRLFYLIPVTVPVTVIPVDTITVVTVVVRSEPGRVVVTVPPPAGAGGTGSDRLPELVFVQP